MFLLQLVPYLGRKRSNRTENFPVVLLYLFVLKLVVESHIILLLLRMKSKWKNKVVSRCIFII